MRERPRARLAWAHVVAMAMLAAESRADSPPRPRCGDIRPQHVADNVVDLADVIATLRFAVGLDVMSDAERLAIDVAPVETVDERTVPVLVRAAPDGAVDVADAVALLRMSVGLEILEGCRAAPTIPPRLLGVTPAESCQGGIPVRLVAWNPSHVPLAPSIGGLPAATLRRWESLDAQGDAMTHLLVATPDMPLPSMGLDVAVHAAPASGDGELRLHGSCTSPPLVIAVSPSHGPRVPGVIELYGDSLACARSAALVGKLTGRRIAAAIEWALDDQHLLVTPGGDALGNGEPFEIVVSSDCGLNAAPRPEWRYDDPGPVAVPDVERILDVSSGLASGASRGGNTVRLEGTSLDIADVIQVGPVELRRQGGDFDTAASGAIVIPYMPGNPGDPFVTETVPVVAHAGAFADATPAAWTWLAEPLPACESHSPSSGGETGGTQLTIRGANLNSIDTVLLGGESAGAVYYLTSNGSAIIVLSPPHPPGAVGIELRAGSRVFECPDAFTYVEVNTQPPDP